MKRLLYLIGVFFALFSCDVVDKPVDKEEEIIIEYGLCDTTALDHSFSDTTWSDTTGDLRKILLEDYTGVGCGNCPSAAVVAHDLLNKYPEQVIVMGVHANWFADTSVYTGYPGFSTNASEAYFDYFKILSNPNGMVNRTLNSGSAVVGTDQWDLTIQSIKDEPNIIDLNIRNIFNSERRTSFLDVDVEFLTDLSGKYKIVSHIIENDIVGKQANYETGGDPEYDSPYEVNYPHSHVLRATYNDLTWGMEVNTENVNAGDIITVSFDKFCIDESFDEKSCEIIVYVYDDNTKEIVQVESLHLTN